jgi:hypothetical protein
MEGGGGAGGASDGDVLEGAWRGASFYADQHEQSCINMRSLAVEIGCLGINHGMSRLVDKDSGRFASKHHCM